MSLMHSLTDGSIVTAFVRIPESEQKWAWFPQDLSVPDLVPRTVPPDEHNLQSSYWASKAAGKPIVHDAQAFCSSSETWTYIKTIHYGHILVI